MNKRRDIFNNIPKINDTVVFNPANYKGLVFGKCVGFVKSGLPEIKLNDNFKGYFGSRTENENYTPKTGFVIVN